MIKLKCQTCGAELQREVSMCTPVVCPNCGRSSTVGGKFIQVQEKKPTTKYLILPECRT